MKSNQNPEDSRQELTLLDIEKHLKCQDREAKKAAYGDFAAFGASIILVGISLLLGIGANNLFASSIFLIAMGFGVMFWSGAKQRNKKGTKRHEY